MKKLTRVTSELIIACMTFLMMDCAIVEGSRRMAALGSLQDYEKRKTDREAREQAEKNQQQKDQENFKTAREQSKAIQEKIVSFGRNFSVRAQLNEIKKEIEKWPVCSRREYHGAVPTEAENKYPYSKYISNLVKKQRAWMRQLESLGADWDDDDSTSFSDTDSSSDSDEYESTSSSSSSDSDDDSDNENARTIQEQRDLIRAMINSLKSNPGIDQSVLEAIEREIRAHDGSDTDDLLERQQMWIVQLESLIDSSAASHGVSHSAAQQGTEVVPRPEQRYRMPQVEVERYSVRPGPTPDEYRSHSSSSTTPNYVTSFPADPPARITFAPPPPRNSYPDEEMAPPPYSYPDHPVQPTPTSSSSSTSSQSPFGAITSFAVGYQGGIGGQPVVQKH